MNLTDTPPKLYPDIRQTAFECGLICLEKCASVEQARSIWVTCGITDSEEEEVWNMALYYAHK